MALTDETFPVEIFTPDDGEPFTDDELQAYIDEAAVVPDKGDVLFGLPEYVEDNGELLPGDEKLYAPRRWMIDDDYEAAWAMQKYADALAALQAVEDRHAYMVERVESWHRSNARDPKARAAFFAHALEEYAIACRGRDAKRKTVKLPNGNISTTARGHVVDVDEEELLLAWAEGAAPAAVNTVKTIRKTELREAVSVVEVPRVVVLTCSCIVDVSASDDLHAWGSADGVTCPECGKEALVGDWLETKLVAVDADGDRVPGARVEPGRVTASAKPA